MDSDIKVSLMQDHHIDVVTAIEEQTSATAWTADIFIKELQSPTHLMLVAIDLSPEKKHEEIILGFTGGQLIGDELHIHSLAVRKDYRRKGIAEKLVLDLLTQCQGRGAKTATLEVRQSNEPAINLYKKLLFNVEGYRKKYYIDNGEDALIMWLHSLEGLKQ